MKAPGLSLPILLTADALEQLEAQPLGDLPGVSHRVLWRFDGSMAGVLTIEAGHHLGQHAHRVHHHHIWMLEGRAVVLGAELGPRSYAHIPSQMHHDVDARETDGCVLFYLYEKTPN